MKLLSKETGGGVLIAVDKNIKSCLRWNHWNYGFESDDWVENHLYYRFEYSKCIQRFDAILPQTKIIWAKLRKHLKIYETIWKSIKEKDFIFIFGDFNMREIKYRSAMVPVNLQRVKPYYKNVYESMKSMGLWWIDK